MAGDFVQGVSGETSGFNTVFTMTFAGAVASGNHVMGIITSLVNTTAPTSVVDDQSNAYTVTGLLATGNGATGVWGFYLENITNAPTVITVTFADSLSASGAAHEVSGLASSSSLDDSAGNDQLAPGTGTDAITCGEVTTTEADDYLFAATFHQFDGGGTIDAGTGYTERVEALFHGGSEIVTTEDKTQAGTGNVTPTFTHSSDANVVSIALAFKVAAGGGGAADFGGPSTAMYRVRLRQY